MELPVLDSVHICNSVQCEERIIIEFHKILPVYLNVCTLSVERGVNSTIIRLPVLVSLHRAVLVCSLNLHCLTTGTHCLAQTFAWAVSVL